MTDASEKKNMAAQHPDKVAGLKKKITDIVLNGRTTIGAKQLNDTGYWGNLNWIKKTEYEKRQQFKK